MHDIFAIDHAGIVMRCDAKKKRPTNRGDGGGVLRKNGSPGGKINQSTVPGRRKGDGGVKKTRNSGEKLR